MMTPFFIPNTTGDQWLAIRHMVILIALSFFIAGVLMACFARRYPTLVFHKRAFILAACHFTICTILVMFAFFTARIETLSGIDSPDPWWHILARWALIILDAPVAAVVWFRPCDGSYHSILWIIGCSAIWSFAFGYSTSGFNKLPEPTASTVEG